MDTKSTEDLNLELMQENNIDSYIKDNRSHFLSPDVTGPLADLCRKYPAPKATLARRAGMSEVYLHQVLSGRRNPSRDRLLCLCIALGAALDEIQALLRQSGLAQLDPRIKRDAIISHGILHQTGLETINDKLFEENEKTLF